MYKQIETEEYITLPNGHNVTPVASLRDDSGQLCHIVNDDHCYVVMIKSLRGEYGKSYYIFPEAFEVLKTLPSPN